MLSLVLLYVQAASCASKEFPLEFDYYLTWVTKQSPEVHVLIKNRTLETQEFTITLKIDQDRCATVLEDQGSLTSRRQVSGAYLPPTNLVGRISAGGVKHRVFLLGGWGYAGPCDVSLVLFSGGLKEPGRSEYIEKGLEIPREPVPIHWHENGSKPNLKLSSVIEEFEDWETKMLNSEVVSDQRQVGTWAFMYLFVRNEGLRPVTVRLVRRELLCEKGYAQWAIRTAAEPGLDWGPFDIAPGGTTVFEFHLEAADDMAPKCSTALQMEYRSTDGHWDLWPLYRIAIRPQTTYQRGYW